MKRKIVDAGLLVRNYLSFSIYSTTAEHEDEARKLIEKYLQIKNNFTIGTTVDRLL